MHRWIATPYGRKIDATDFSDEEFAQMKIALYTPLVDIDPLQLCTLNGADGEYFCSPGIYNLYTFNNGNWWLGLALSHETRGYDKDNKPCTFMHFERATLKRNQSEGIRTALRYDKFTVPMTSKP